MKTMMSISATHRRQARKARSMKPAHDVRRRINEKAGEATERQLAEIQRTFGARWEW